MNIVKNKDVKALVKQNKSLIRIYGVHGIIFGAETPRIEIEEWGKSAPYEAEVRVYLHVTGTHRPIVGKIDNEGYRETLRKFPQGSVFAV